MKKSALLVTLFIIGVFAKDLCPVPNRDGFYERCDYLASNFTKPLSKRTVARWKKACNTGDLQSCYKLSLAYATGNGTYRSFYRANKLWRLTCENGNAKSCYNLANSYLLHHGVEMNLSMARDYFDLACDMGFRRACPRKR